MNPTVKGLNNQEECMKTLKVTSALVLATLVLNACTLAMSFPREAPRIVLGGKLNCPYVSTSGGTAYLQISLSASDVVRPDRRPMNIACVLDRSGSMGDARKIEYAKQALLRLIDQLTSQDIFSLVIYDDVIEVPFPAGYVESKEALRRLVDRIDPRGSTNLGGGMTEGFRQVERNLRKESVNRVILLSDGLANRGVTDPNELKRIAGRYRERAISLTTMGVGLEYNENLMVDLSQAGGGNYYFIESPFSLASIMSGELNTLSCVVVQNASIVLTLGHGVRVNDVIGCDHREAGNTYIVPVGDVCANDHREFTVELSIPEGTGLLKVATGELKYDSERIHGETSSAFTVYAHYTRDAAVIEKNKDWETQARADVAVSTRAVEHAMNLLDEGKHAEAQQTLNEAKQALQSAPAADMSVEAAAAIRNQAAIISGYSTTLRDSASDARLAKKSIQYDNYRMQRKK